MFPARSFLVLRLFQKRLNDFLAHLKDGEPSVLIISVTLNNWHVELGDLLPEVFRLMKRFKAILVQLCIVLFGYALLALGLLIIHIVTCLTKNLLRILAPILHGLVLRVGRLYCGILVGMHLDNQLLRIGRELFLDWPAQVAI